MKTIPIQKAAAEDDSKDKKSKSFFSRFRRVKHQIEVGTPYNVKHHIHVDFDARTGFSGLPANWETMLLGNVLFHASF